MQIVRYTDDEVVDGIKNNKSWAIECLYTMDKNGIFNFVMNNNGDEEDAQDVLQEGVLSVCNNIISGSYERKDTAQLKTYLNKVCQFRWYKELRKRRPNYKIPEGFEIEDEGSDGGEKEEMIELLSKYFSQLGDKCQSVLRLRFWEKKKMEEIAEILGNTLQVVKNRSSKCIGELYDMFKK
jgi:RNA polymerase sigma factor (sigma-70 family)